MQAVLWARGCQTQRAAACAGGWSHRHLAGIESESEVLSGVCEHYGAALVTRHLLGRLNLSISVNTCSAHLSQLVGRFVGQSASLFVAE